MLKSIKVLFVTCLLCAVTSALNAKVVDRTVAIVNGEAIMSSEYDKVAAPVIEQYKQQAVTAEQTPEKLNEFKQKLMDQMIDDKILKQESKKDKIHVSKRELEEGIKQVKKRFKTDAEFQDELVKEDLTQPQFEKRIEDQLMVMKLIDQEVKSKVPPPAEDDIKAFYEKVQSKMAGKDLGLPKKDEDEIAALAKYLTRLTSEQVRAKHILVAVDKNATLDQKSAALKKIKSAQAEKSEEPLPTELAFTRHWYEAPPVRAAGATARLVPGTPVTLNTTTWVATFLSSIL